MLASIRQTVSPPARVVEFGDLSAKVIPNQAT